MAKPFEVGIGDLISEFFAHTFIIFGFKYSARAIPARAFKSFADICDHVLIGIQNNFHTITYILFL